MIMQFDLRSTGQAHVSIMAMALVTLSVIVGSAAALTALVA